MKPLALPGTGHAGPAAGTTQRAHRVDGSPFAALLAAAEAGPDPLAAGLAPGHAGAGGPAADTRALAQPLLEEASPGQVPEALAEVAPAITAGLAPSVGAAVPAQGARSAADFQGDLAAAEPAQTSGQPQRAAAESPQAPVQRHQLATAESPRASGEPHGQAASSPRASAQPRRAAAEPPQAPAQHLQRAAAGWTAARGSTDITTSARSEVSLDAAAARASGEPAVSTASGEPPRPGAASPTARPSSQPTLPRAPGASTASNPVVEPSGPEALAGAPVPAALQAPGEAQGPAASATRSSPGPWAQPPGTTQPATDRAGRPVPLAEAPRRQPAHELGEVGAPGREPVAAGAAPGETHRDPASAEAGVPLPIGPATRASGAPDPTQALHTSRLAAPPSPAGGQPSPSQHAQSLARATSPEGPGPQRTPAPLDERDPAPRPELPSLLAGVAPWPAVAPTAVARAGLTASREPRQAPDAVHPVRPPDIDREEPVRPGSPVTQAPPSALEGLEGLTLRMSPGTAPGGRPPAGPRQPVATRDTPGVMHRDPSPAGEALQVAVVPSGGLQTTAAPTDETPADARAPRSQAVRTLRAPARDAEAEPARSSAAAMPASSEGRPLPGEAEAALAVARALGAAAAAAHPLPLFDTRAAELKAVVAQNGTDAAASHARSSLSPATLAGAAAAARPVHGARAPEEVRAPVDLEEKRRARPEDVLGTSAPASATRGPAPLDLAVAVLPPPVVIPQAFEAILPQLVDDPSLRLALTGAQARLSVDTGDAGQLSLQLRVHDGVTEIRAAGPAAPMMDARQNELRVALAHEGLSLGQFDLTQSQSQQRHDRQEATEPERPPPPPRATSQGPQQSTTQGRVHVRA